MPDFTELIEDAAEEGVKKASADGVSVEAHTIPELIQADQYTAAKRNVTGSGWSACRPARVVPPGAVGPYAGE